MQCTAAYDATISQRYHGTRNATALANSAVTLVAKLAAARRRKRMATGEKVDGRKSHAEVRPEVVKLAKALARKKPKGGRLRLRAIAAALAARGDLNERGKPFNPKSIAALLAS